MTDEELESEIRAMLGAEPHDSAATERRESLAEWETAVAAAVYAESPQARAVRRAEVEKSAEARLRRASLRRRLSLAQTNRKK